MPISSISVYNSYSSAADQLMTSQDHETIILKLDALIQETRLLIEKVEQHGLDQTQPKDYDQLLTILGKAVNQQREHTIQMLNKE